MYVNVDVYDYVETDVEINNSFINSLQERLEYFVEKNFEKEEDRNKYKEHIDAIVECIESCKIVQGKNIADTNFKRKVYKRFNDINRKYAICQTTV